MLKLRHPNVIESILLNTPGDAAPLIVMELMPLGDLRTFVLNRYSMHRC